MPQLVSVLIPAYNAERWLAASIESALAQSWPHIEILIVDDGSTDGTLAIARRYESRMVRVITQPNQGSAAARNTAFQHCQGDYIQWLDADDLLVPGKIASQMQVASEYGDPRILLSGPWAHFMYRTEGARYSPTLLWDDLSPVDWMVRKWTHNLHMQTATWLVSRQLSTATGPWNSELVVDDDGEYFARIVLASRRVSFVRDARVLYRVVGTGRVSHVGLSDAKREAQLKSMKLQIAYLRSVDDSNSVRAAALSYLQTWLPLFYPERPDLVREVQQLAKSVGGELQIPRASARYALVEALFGFGAAKRAQLHYNVGKTFVARSWDRMLYALHGR